jgi:hypothetical protein
MFGRKKKKQNQSQDADPNFELNNKLDGLVKKGMTKTQMWAELWQDALRYFFSDQVSHKKKHKNWDWLVNNYIWPSAVQEASKLAKNHPRIIGHPWDDNDVEVAETWQAKLQWDWKKGLTGRDMRVDQIEAIFDGKIYGYRVSKIYWEDQVRWDDTEKRWEGNVRYRLWKPNQFWAVAEEKIDDDACGTVRPVSLDWAIQRWPEFETELKLEADKFTPETGISDGIRGSQSATGTTAARAAGVFAGGSERDLNRRGGPVNYLIGLLTTLIGVSGTTATSGDTEKLVKIEEIYLKDYSTVDKKTEEDIPKEELLAGGQITEKEGIFYNLKGKPITADQWPKRVTRKWAEPKFPNGRFIIRCGRTILNPDEVDQKYPHSRWPFVVVPHYLLPHMWQGLNAVELYKSMQDMINISTSYLFNNMKMYGTPTMAVEEDALALNPKTKKHWKIGMGAGAIIRLARGGLKKFMRLETASVSQATLLLFQLFTQEFKNLTGLQSIGRGEKQKGKMTATEASHLAMSANDRIHLQSVYEDEWIRGLMSLDAEISQLHYSPNQWIRIVGSDRVAGVAQITQQMKDARFDVDIEPASTLPFDEEKKQARYLQAYKLLSDPNPNPLLPEVLRVLEISNWKKVLAEHQSWQLFTQFKQLAEAVRAGEIDPQEAVRALVQRAVQEFGAEQTAPQEKA